MTVECVFGSLKVHWWCLLPRLDLSEKNITMATGACCVLHNIWEVKEEKLLQAWRAELEHLSAAFEWPDTRGIRRAHCRGIWLREALEELFNSAPQECVVVYCALPGSTISGPVRNFVVLGINIGL